MPPSSTDGRWLRFGLCGYSHARPRLSASLLVRVPAAKCLIPVLSCGSLRPRTNSLLRLASTPPTGTLIAHRPITCQAHERRVLLGLRGINFTASFDPASLTGWLYILWLENRRQANC